MANIDNVPGEKISEIQANNLIIAFRKKFRERQFKKYPLNVPTACCLEGIKDESIFSNSTFLNLNKIYILFDYDNDLRLASPSDIKDFYNNLEPWEDYDFCLFDDTFSWCIGVTHNNDVIVVDSDGLFDDA